MKKNSVHLLFVKNLDGEMLIYARSKNGSTLARDGEEPCTHGLAAARGSFTPSLFSPEGSLFSLAVAILSSCTQQHVPSCWGAQAGVQVSALVHKHVQGVGLV